MKLVILYILIVVMSLASMSYIYQLTPITYNAADTEFAHEYAGQMQVVLQNIQQQGTQLDANTKPRLWDYFLDELDGFSREKDAAIHYKGELAEDFVYAFTLAEDWCRYASKAAYDDHDLKSRKLAEDCYRKAYSEFQAIASKDYTSKNICSQ